jgi:microcystin-dependent protein
MADPFIAEIRMMSFGFAPSGWAQCNGQLLPINQNQALFSLLGTVYGGDGRVNFALPNLQGGEQTHTLITGEMPTHTHSLFGSSATANAVPPNPGGNILADSNPASAYGPLSGLIIEMNTGSVTSVGGGQAHPNMQPFLTINFCIALQGVFPSQN